MQGLNQKSQIPCKQQVTFIPQTALPYYIIDIFEGRLLNPIDNQVSWNNYFKRWEIKVDVNGFGGFFVKSSKMNTGLTRQQSKSNNISIFPNPSEGKFNVKVDHPNEILLSILTITGQLVQSQTISSRSEFEMDLGDIEPGIYVAKFSTGEVFKLFLKK